MTAPKRERPWYLRPEYLLSYTLRELTAVFVLLYAGVLLAGLAALAGGPEAFADYQRALTRPLWIGLHGLMLIAALYNSWTWFRVAPKAMPQIFVGARRLPDRPIVLAHIVAFILVSAAIFAWAVAA